MPRESISPEQREAEAKALRKFFEHAKLEDASITQEGIANEMGVTQGLVFQWLSGRTPIPNKRLAWLSRRLKFDATLVRSSIGTSAITAPTEKQKLIIERYMTNPDFSRMVDALAESTGHYPPPSRKQ